MEYDKGLTEHELQKKAAAFSKAIERKLGHPTTSDNSEEVKKMLKQEVQDRLTRDKMRIFEGIYGWCYTVGYGKAGECIVLDKEDLA